MTHPCIGTYFFLSYFAVLGSEVAPTHLTSFARMSNIILPGFYSLLRNNSVPLYVPIVAIGLASETDDDNNDDDNDDPLGRFPHPH